MRGAQPTNSEMSRVAPMGSRVRPALSVPRLIRGSDKPCAFPLFSLLASVSAALALAGCGGEAESYPLVTESPEPRVTITDSSGAVVERPPKPAQTEVRPSATCERIAFPSPSGEDVVNVVPPAPGLSARAVSGREIDVSWSFQELPDTCRPSQLLVSIVANEAALATPTNATVDVTEPGGTVRLVYPDFLPEPDVALASALGDDGRKSRTVRVLIVR
jgi:hypothetical protein